ncbi:MAG: hypothetical protein ACR2QH_15340 [Geminicoccaceae bacterium]
MTFEPQRLRPVGVNPVTLERIWHYSSLFDDLATILAPNYFQSDNSSIAINDVVWVVGTDFPAMTAVDTIIGTDITLKNIETSGRLTGVEFVSSTQSITPPEDSQTVFYILVGGGGGSGGFNETSGFGGGGGEGGAVVIAASLNIPLTSETVTIGAAGANGTDGASPTAGSDGGDTTYLNSVADGGSGGAAGGASAGGAAGDGPAVGTVGAGSTGSGLNGSNASVGGEFDAVTGVGTSTRKALGTGRGGGAAWFDRGRGGGGSVGGAKQGAQSGMALLQFYGGSAKVLAPGDIVGSLRGYLPTVSTTISVPGTIPEPFFGGPFAPWAIPASSLATDPNSAAEITEIYNIVPGRFNVNSRNFCPAAFDEDDATLNATVNATNTSLSNIANGTTVPWNPAWVFPTDSDATGFTFDPVTGVCRTFSNGFYDIGANRIDCTIAQLIQTGVEPTSGSTGNILTKENGTRVQRACGLAYPLMTIMRAEIDAGLIPHCTTLLIPQPSQFEFSAPAIKGAGTTGGGPGRSKMGVRIVWDGLTVSDLDTWEATLAVGVRPAMRTIAECLRDYGAIMTDNGGNAVNGRGAIWLEHDNSADWDAIGFTSADTLTALHSLLEPNQAKARVVEIPNHVGGSDANVACYPSFNYPSGHPCNP